MHINRWRKIIIVCVLLGAVLSISIVIHIFNTWQSKSLVPEEYAEVLELYKEIADSIVSEEFEKDYYDEKFPSPNPELDYEWHCMLVELNLWSFDSMEKTKDSFGYVLKDINGDDIQELFFMLHDCTILAAFSISGEEANLLDAYWPRHRCMLLDSGELYTFSSSGAQDFEYKIQKLDKDGRALSDILQFGSEEGSYYKIVEENEDRISDKEFEKLRMEYPDIFDNSDENAGKMKLKWIPLFK